MFLIQNILLSGMKVWSSLVIKFFMSSYLFLQQFVCQPTPNNTMKIGNVSPMSIFDL